MKQGALFAESEVAGAVLLPAVVRCRECGRPLKSREARHAGVGSTCALRQAGVRRVRRERRQEKRRRILRAAAGQA